MNLAKKERLQKLEKEMENKSEQAKRAERLADMLTDEYSNLGLEYSKLEEELSTQCHMEECEQPQASGDDFCSAHLEIVKNPKKAVFSDPEDEAGDEIAREHEQDLFAPDSEEINPEN